MNERKRHRWVGDKCRDCDMTRERVTERKRAGYYGRREYTSTVYRHRRGYLCNMGGGRIPPCVPWQMELHGFKRELLK